jgi:hypothetical protein
MAPPPGPAEAASEVVILSALRLENPQNLIDRKTPMRLFSGILAALSLGGGCKKLNPQPPGQRSEDWKDGELMKHAYTQITVDSVSVRGAVALGLCIDRLRSIPLAAPFTRMQKTTITDP